MARQSAYRAISDPTRRRILDVLRAGGPLRAGDIAGRFPEISRPAVSRHLRILRRARLVQETQDGRERWYRLDAEPLREMYEGWLRLYATLWTERLQTVKRLVEKEERKRRVGREVSRGRRREARHAAIDDPQGDRHRRADRSRLVVRRNARRESRQA